MNNKSLSECSREELLEIIKSLKKQKKFGLVWEDKPEKVATECRTKLPVVKEVTDKAINDAGIMEATNLIIEGDNYHALSVLSYTHAGKIDVIYIDPPYNTGNKDFIYNDKLIDKDDSFRHSKWLSFMSRRLHLAKNLLNNQGIICISIDDNEETYLKVLCDEVFGSNNFIGCAPRKTRGSATTKGFAELQTLGDYLLIYAKNKAELVLQKKIVGQKTYPHSDSRGKFYIVPLQDNGPHGTREARPNLWYPIFELDDGSLTYEEPTSFKCKLLPAQHQNKEGCWMWSKPKFERDRQDLLVKDGKVWIKHYYNPDEDQNKYQYEKLWLDGFLNAKGTKRLSEVIGRKQAFSNPKPVELVSWCLRLHSNKAGIALDFFAGSGTTGQAVLELNKEDGGHRQFILCTNNENGIAEEVTYPRIKAVVEGYGNTEGIPANVRYFKTDFVEKDETLDKLRRKLSPACEDMIRIREGAFNRVIDEDKFKVYKNARGLTAIVFDRFELADYIARIEELETDTPVHLYVFSYTNYGRLDELSDSLNHTYESQPIPEGVLEIYKRIFNKGGKR